MKLKDINSRFSSNVVNVDKKQPVRTQTKIIEQQVIRTSKDIQDWRDAISSAENVHIPNRTPLQIVYDDVLIDGHVTGIINSIKNKIKAKEFMLVKEDGEEDEDATKLFMKKWFFKYLDEAVMSKFRGFTLLELGDIKDDGFPDIKSVNRRHVVPEWDIVKTDTFSVSQKEGFEYKSPTNVNWFIFLGDPDDLGLLNVVAPHALSKKNVLSAAWQYAELFGMPIRLGKTDIDDDARRTYMEKMMRDMGKAAWAVVDEEDKVEMVESTRTDAHKVFTEPVKVSNQEMSKALAGAVGIFDEKAFVGASEAGERLFQEFVSSDSRNIVFDINNELIPRMVFHGIDLKGRSFKWKTEEALTTKEKIEAVVSLSAHYVITPEEVKKQTGIEVEALKNTTPSGGEEESSHNVTSVMAEVAELYKIEE